jgi:hypothetical protein
MPRDGNAGLSLGLLERYLLDNLENGKDWLHRIVSRVLDAVVLIRATELLFAHFRINRK